MKYYKVSIILGILSIGYILYKWQNHSNIESMTVMSSKMKEIYTKYNIKIDSKNQTLTKDNQTISYKNNLNSQKARAFASNKTNVNLLLSKHKMPICKLVTWNNSYSDSVNLKTINRELTFPVIVKPQSGEKGWNVFTDLYNNEDVMHKINILKQDRVDKIILEEQAFGEKYRILIINQRVIFIRKDTIPAVSGDGIHTLDALIKNFNVVNKEHPIQTIDKNVIKRQGYDMNSVVEKSKKVNVSHVVGVSNGSFEELIDISKVNKETMKMFVDISKILDLNVCGLDYIAKDLRVPYTVDGKFIEVNANPGISRKILNHEEIAERVIDALFMDKK